MENQTQTMAVCNVCYRCREYVTIGEGPAYKRKLLIFTELHSDHPHGYNPKINLARYRCVDSTIDSNNKFFL